MKKFLLLFLTIFSIGLNIGAEEGRYLTEEQYNNLPTRIKKEIEVENTIDKASKYTSIGKEIGIAVNETLNALESGAQKISNTRLGRIAIAILVWKLLYKDVLSIVVGAILLIVSIKNYIKWRSFRKIKEEIPEETYAGTIIVSVVTFFASMLCFFV